MGGSSDKKPTKRAKSSSPRPPTDPCDLEFSVDLVGVRPDVLAGFAAGESLKVAVEVRGSAKSVVCKTRTGEVAGALAAFRGLAQLINCLDSGESFEAAVQAVTTTRCTVLVRRM
jgi:hypothetical protein